MHKIKTRNVTRSMIGVDKAGREPSGVNSVQVARQPSKQKQTEEEDPNDVESAQFEEDGDVVHMEINDGGAAVAEFKSDYDSDESESEEEEDLADDQTEPDYEDVDHNSFTDEGATVSETESEGAVSSQQDKRAKKTKQNKKSDELQRLRVEAKLDSLSSSLEMMKDLFLQSGIMTGKAGTKENDGAGPSTSRQQTGKDVISNQSSSETTIYRNVLNKRNNDQSSEQEVIRPSIHEPVDSEIMFKVSGNDKLRNRESSSSDERGDTSDELIGEIEGDARESFIADCAAEAHRRSMSSDQSRRRRDGHDKADEMIRWGERSHERIYALPGNVPIDCLNAGKSSAAVDKFYIMVGGNVNPSLEEKIKRGEYIYFGKLLPRDKATDENKLDLVFKGGQTFFVPSSGKDNYYGVTNFHKWEQAFRAYSNIYLREHPERAMELVQYNHVIFTASSAYSWDNVYAYDKEFHIHMGKFPGRNWGLILQQAWTMLLKDRVNRNGEPKQGGGKFTPKKEICKKFNKGLCNAGMGCSYEHRCFGCNKFGHGVHICRQRNEGKRSNSANHANNGSNNGNASGNK